MRKWRLAEVLAASCLDAVLFVGTQNKILFAKGLSTSKAMIQAQDAASLGREQRVPRKNPAAVAPRQASG